MATLVSPGVQIKEKDLTNIIVGESTSIGGVAIVAERGPVEEIVTVSNETELVEAFGKPNGSTFEWFFSAASFLKYASVLRVVRINSGHLNATAGVGAAAGTGLLVKNSDHWYDTYGDGSGGPLQGEWVARSAGTWGNNISVALCPSSTAYELNMGANNLVDDAAALEGDTTITIDDVDKVGYEIAVNDIISFTTDTAGLIPVAGHEAIEYIVTAVDDSANTVTFKQFGVFSTKGLAANLTDDSNITRRWRYYEEFAGAPGTSQFVTDRSGSGDEMHIIVLDEDGGISGTAGTILEKWAFVSKASDARTDSGDVNYYVDVLHRSSEFIYWLDHLGSTNFGQEAGTAFTDVKTSSSESLAGGTDDYLPTNGEKLSAYELMDDDTVDVSLIFGGPGDATHATNLIDIAEKRKDLMVFISPERADIVNVTNSNTQLNNVRSFFLNLPSTSYAVFDSGYKKMYDKYNDVFRWVPLNADVAGACAATDNDNDPWWSPGGLVRGQIRSSVGLAFNPTQSQRDTLYRNRINPIASFPGEGTVLWGDKTALSSNSAFSRINVRRLFNTVESVIKTAARSMLFEFNDDFTRAQFIGMVEPFLRDVQGRRGITDFLVVCDETNNTGQVIDANEFRADIYIKPARSINFITLTFVAARTGVEFSEIIS
jgi:hypothetical protein